MNALILKSRCEIPPICGGALVPNLTEVLEILLVVDNSGGGYWYTSIKKPEQLPPHVPAFLWTQLLKLSGDMISTCYRLIAFRGSNHSPEGVKTAFSGRSFP
jgi:hypothetical protein